MNAAALRTRARHWWVKDIRPLLILAVVLFAIRSSLADWNDVPTGSMKPTILEGDRVYVNKLAYDLKVPFTTTHIMEWSNPQRGEIVVFYSPYDGKRLVKRVIGLPGDTIELRDDSVILNGTIVEQQSFNGASLGDLSPTDRATHLFATENLPGRPHPIATWPAVPPPWRRVPPTPPQGNHRPRASSVALICEAPALTRPSFFPKDLDVRLTLELLVGPTCRTGVDGRSRLPS
jgi:signal peptidase I